MSKIKHFLYRLKLVLSIQETIIHISIIVFLFFAFLVLILLGINYLAYSSLYFLIAGTILSIEVSYITETVDKYRDKYNEIINVIVLCDNLYNFLRDIYLEFFNHPLKDAICKNGKNIIYVSPILAGSKFFDEQQLIKYMLFIKLIDKNKFIEYFSEQSTRLLIYRLKNKINWMQTNQINFFALKENIPTGIVTEFIEFVSLYMNLVNMDEYNWGDSQLKECLIQLLSSFILVHCSLIGKLQRYIYPQIKYVEILKSDLQ